MSLVNVAPGGVLVNGTPSPGLAAHGYDVVSYFTEGKPVQGVSEFAAVHDNASYRFSSQKNLDLFLSEPDHYAPQYGGFCAYGVSVGARFDGDARYWSVVEDKLYLNLDQKISDIFNKDVSGAIAKANANWPLK